MSRKIAIINVGANSKSGALESPLFKDRTFEFVPTKTDIPNNPAEFDTFAGFKSFNGRPILDFIPEKFLSESMHNDPEFVTHTYGDTPESVPNSSMSYFFCWDNIPGNENEILIEFLNLYFGIEWVKTAKIDKIDGDRTIKLSSGRNLLSLKLDDEKPKVDLKFYDGRINPFYNFISKMENNKLNIYSKLKSSPKASNLKELTKGDTLYYLARLVEWDNGTWGKPGFYLIGKLVLDRIIKKSDLEENPTLITTVQNNAHVKRWLIKPEAEPWNFWVLVGSDQSKRFVHAVPFDKNIIQKILLRRDGEQIKFKQGKPDLRTIGEDMRPCRKIDNPDCIKILEEHVKEYW